MHDVTEVTFIATFRNCQELLGICQDAFTKKGKSKTMIRITFYSFIGNTEKEILGRAHYAGNLST